MLCADQQLRSVDIRQMKRVEEEVTYDLVLNAMKTFLDSKDKAQQNACVKYI